MLLLAAPGVLISTFSLGVILVVSTQTLTFWKISFILFSPVSGQVLMYLCAGELLKALYPELTSLNI